VFLSPALFFEPARVFLEPFFIERIAAGRLQARLAIPSTPGRASLLMEIPRSRRTATLGACPSGGI